MGINFSLCVFCVVYLVLICNGFGTGQKNCVCCWINFKEEVEEADHEYLMYKDKAVIRVN